MNMNAELRFLLAVSLLSAAPIFAATHAHKPSTPMPSAQLRHMIDTTMTKIAVITNPKQTFFNRTSADRSPGPISRPRRR